jgi:hypothetical protein
VVGDVFVKLNGFVFTFDSQKPQVKGHK